jgi:hypothetical protein
MRCPRASTRACASSTFTFGRWASASSSDSMGRDRPSATRASNSSKVMAWSRLNGPEAVRRNSTRCAPTPSRVPTSAASGECTFPWSSEPYPRAIGSFERNHLQRINRHVARGPLDGLASARIGVQGPAIAFQGRIHRRNLRDGPRKPARASSRAEADRSPTGCSATTFPVTSRVSVSTPKRTTAS